MALKKDIDNIVLEALHNDMDLNILKSAFDRPHRIGNIKNKKSLDQSLLNLFNIMIEEGYL